MAQTEAQCVPLGILLPVSYTHLVDLRNEVECQLVSEFLNGYGFACQYLAVLLVQLIVNKGNNTTK